MTIKILMEMVPPMKDKQPHEMSMREQFDGLLAEYDGKYPDAMNYLRLCLKSENIDEMLTEYDKFTGLLDGSYQDFWHDCPYRNEYGNKIDMIKWYRIKTGVGLREAKEKCDDYLEQQYGSKSPYVGSEKARNGFYRL